MHSTLVSAIGLASLFTGTHARALVERQAQCINDSVRKGLWENPPIRNDVNTFCNSLLGMPLRTNCVFYETPTATVYNGDVTSTKTVTDTTEVPTRTVTITTTSTEFALKKLMARAAIPTAPYLKEARDAIHAEIEKRQASGFVTPDYAATITSGCQCGPPTPLTTNDICTDDAVTTTLDGFNITTSYVTVSRGVTTVYEYVNVTTKINTSSFPTSRSHSNWDDWTKTTSTTSYEVEPTMETTTSRATSQSSSKTSQSSSIEPEPSATTTTRYTRPSNSDEPAPSSTTTGSTSEEPTFTSTAITSHGSSSSEEPEPSSTPTTYSRSWTSKNPESTSNTTIGYSWSRTEEPETSSASDTPSGTSRTTTTSASASATPTACPEKNGSTIPSNYKPCMEYEYICGRTYEEGSFYDVVFRYATPEDCLEQCDAQNLAGRTLCKGIVWNTTDTGPNCHTLKSLDGPVEDESSVALILRDIPGCGVSSTTPAYPSMPTGTQSRTHSWWPTGSWTKTWDHNGTWSYNHTRTWPTSYSKPTWTTVANITVDADLTYTTSTTAYYNSTAPYPTSTGTANVSSTIPSNTTKTPYSYSNTYTLSSGTGTGYPSSTLNSTSTTSSCPVSYVTVPETVYMTNMSTFTETISYDVRTVTVPVTTCSVSVSVSTSTVTVTVATGARWGGGWRNW